MISTKKIEEFLLLEALELLMKTNKQYIYKLNKLIN